MKDRTEVLIFGAGVAGLAAGCYARMNGFDTLIIEQHFLPGGLCTSWERDDYIFDGCISYLYGTAPGMPFNDLWQELGVADRQFIHREEFIRVRDETGHEVIGWADPETRCYHIFPELRPPSEAELKRRLWGGGCRRALALPGSELT